MGKFKKALGKNPTVNEKPASKPAKIKSLEKSQKSKLTTTDKNKTPTNRVKSLVVPQKHDIKKTAQKRKLNTSVESDSFELSSPSLEKLKNVAAPVVTEEEVLLALKATFELINKGAEDKNELFENESRILLLINNVKIPKCPTRRARIQLPNSLVAESADVCLFVLDLKRGRKVDHEPTIQHYEDLLRSHNVTKIPAIIPLRMLKTEFNQFELKRRLLSQYDQFLTDSRICGNVFHLLGNSFLKKKKLSHSVRMESKNLKTQIDKALSKTQIHLSSRGNTTVVEVGHAQMSKQHISENVLAVITWLAEYYPGGWENIRGLFLKTGTSAAVPLYWSLKSRNTVNIPVVLSKKAKMTKVVEGELTTIPGAKVKVFSDGTVEVIKDEDAEESDSADELEDEDLEEQVPKQKIKKDADVPLKKEKLKKFKKEATEQEADSDTELGNTEDSYLQTYEREQLESKKKAVDTKKPKQHGKKDKKNQQNSPKDGGNKKHNKKTKPLHTQPSAVLAKTNIKNVQQANKNIAKNKKNKGKTAGSPVAVSSEKNEGQQKNKGVNKNKQAKVAGLITTEGKIKNKSKIIKNNEVQDAQKSPKSKKSKNIKRLQ